jgi:hypothetical protein
MTTIYLFIYKSLSLFSTAQQQQQHTYYYCLAKSQTLIDRDFLRYLKTKIVPKIFILGSRRILDDYNQSAGIATDTTATHSVSQSVRDRLRRSAFPSSLLLQSPSFHSCCWWWCCSSAVPAAVNLPLLLQTSSATRIPILIPCGTILLV